MNNEKRIAEIRDCHDGNLWTDNQPGTPGYVETDVSSADGGTPIASCGDHPEGVSLAATIAGEHNAIPELLATIKAQAAELAKYREALEPFAGIEITLVPQYVSIPGDIYQGIEAVKKVRELLGIPRPPKPEGEGR